MDMLDQGTVHVMDRMENYGSRFHHDFICIHYLFVEFHVLLVEHSEERGWKPKKIKLQMRGYYCTSIYSLYIQ
jgi:hypothetical protein